MYISCVGGGRLKSRRLTSRDHVADGKLDSVLCSMQAWV